MGKKKSHLTDEANFSFWKFYNEFMFQGIPQEQSKAESIHPNSESSENNLPVDETSAETYLNRDVILTSLAKEQFQKTMEKIDLSDIEKRLFSIKGDVNDTLLDIIRKISRSIVRPILRSMESADDEYATELLNMVDKSFHVSLSFSTGNVSWRYATKRLDAGDCLITLKIQEKGYPELDMTGTKNATHAAHRKSTLFRNGIMVADIGEVLSLLIILSQIKKELRRLKARDVSDGKTALYDELLSMQHQPLNDIPQDSCIVAVYSLENPEADCISKSVKDWIETQRHVKFVSTYEEAMKLLRNAKTMGTIEPVILTRLLSRKILAANFTAIGDFNYHDLVPCKDGMYWPYLNAREFKYSDGNALSSFLCKFYKILYQWKYEHYITISYLKENASDYAKSYEQKKNIPKKILAAMRSSEYNNYFGYVEYDESCDIEKISENAKEFSAIKNCFLPFVDCKKNVIRFRRLGNHKAAGLYYPKLKCLCIDVNNPWSTIHEFGHLIDYEYGMLSLQDDFTEIKSLYRIYLSNIPISKKGKYNMDYYLQPTEIFARAFELYMVYAKGIHNSLAPSTFSKEYCQDANFIGKVTSYFDSLFYSLNAECKVSA